MIKKLLKKVLIITIFLIIGMLLINTKVYGASVGMSINKTSAYIGDSFTVTISGINGKVNITGNANVSLNTSGTQWVEGSMTITGTAKSAGTGSITVTPIDASTTGANPVEVTGSASKNISITAKPTPKPTTQKPATTTKPATSTNKTEEKKDDFYITKLTLKGVKENGEKVDITLSPKFSKNVYKYSCKVESDIQKIELVKDAGNYTKYITVDGLKELKEGENTITLKLAAKGQKTKTYTIKVTKEAATVETNNEPQVDNAITENEQTQNKKEPKIVSMPLGVFIALESRIIIIEAAIFCIVFRKKLFSKNH